MARAPISESRFSWEAFDVNGPGRHRWEHEREVQMNARPRPTQSQFFEDSSLLKPSAEAPAIRLIDDQFPSWQPSVGKLVPLDRVSKLGRLEPPAFARYLITFSIGVAVALAWQSYGNATREATSLKAISLDIDAVRQTIDRDRKSTRLNSSHQIISYAVFFLK